MSALSLDHYEDVYEKWLRRRLDYAVIRETGSHAAPGLIHTVLHAGDCPAACLSELRDELWVQNQIPSASYFAHGVIAYTYPDKLKEFIDFRFAGENCDVTAKPKSEAQFKGAYHVSLAELASRPRWINPLLMSPCRQPHCLETPMTWPQGWKPPKVIEHGVADPRRVHTPSVRGCCYKKDDPCSTVHCRQPAPTAHLPPGPLVPGDLKVTWD